MSLVNGYIAFPKAGFDGKSRYGVNAGLMAQVNLSSHFALETGAQYELLRAKCPDEGDLFDGYLPYQQQSILVPANLLVNIGGAPGVDAFMELGGFYGRVLTAELLDAHDNINPNQWGLSWAFGFRFGKVKISGGRRYQLNPFFVGDEGLPSARIHAGSFSVGYYF